MSRREETLKHIQKLFASLPSEADGIIIDSYEGMEVGIRTYNYDVIQRMGFIPAIGRIRNLNYQNLR